MNPLLIIIAAIAFSFKVIENRKTEKSKTFFNEKQVVTKVWNDYNVYTLAFSRPFNIEQNIILGIIAQESGGDPNALGTIGERGLMQLTKGALHDVNQYYNQNFTFDDMWIPIRNIKTGTYYLAWLKDRFNGNINLAIQAYNAGIGNVRKNNETGTGYRNKVLKWASLMS